MVEVVIIPKSITPSIVWWVDIDELHFSCETRPQRVESDEIISFDQEIFREITLYIKELYRTRISDRMDSICIDFFESCQDFRFSEDIDIRSIHRLMEKFLFSPYFFTRHPSFEDTVLIRKREDDIARLMGEWLFFCIEKSDLVGVMSDSSLAERIIHKKALTKVNAKIECGLGLSETKGQLMHSSSLKHTRLESKKKKGLSNN